MRWKSRAGGLAPHPAGPGAQGQPPLPTEHHAGSSFPAGAGFDVMIDASGSRHAVAGLLDIAAPGGTVVYGAMYPEDYELPLNLSDHLYRKELTLTGVFVSPYTFPRAVRLLDELDLDPFLESVVDLDQAAEAFRVHLSGQYPKVVIRCNDLADPSADQVGTR